MNIVAGTEHSYSISREGLAFLILKMRADGQMNISGYASSDELFHSENLNEAHIAVLDYNCLQEDGLKVVKALHAANKEMEIFVISSGEEGTMKGFRVHPTGYLIKRISDESLQSELKQLLPSKDISPPVMEGIMIRCFGSFEAFLNGTPIHFHYQKTKELLAYLIDRRGTMCTNRELETYLWSDAPDSDKRHYAYLLKLKEELIRIFREAGYDHLLIRTRGNIAVNSDKIDCDYYRYLEGSIRPEDQFRGEYMRQYSWAEYTLGYLLSKEAAKKEDVS